MRLLLLMPLALATVTAVVSTPQNQISGRSDDRALPGTLSLEEIRAALAEEGAHESFVPERPLGLNVDLADHIPANNPMTPAKVELGRQLYFDKRLSRDGSISCATCHDPAMGWTDNLPVSLGLRGQKGGRSAPTVINRLLGLTQFWDGRAASLEEQAVGPIANPIEMGFTHPEVVDLLTEIQGYRIQFEAIFGGGPTIDRVGQALATFERTILSGASKNDYFEAALPFFEFEPDEDEDPEILARMDRALLLEETHRMSLQAERGRGLFFGKASCSACHVGSDLTDEDFHNIGIGTGIGTGTGTDLEFPDLGRAVVTGDPSTSGAFKTPTVRNIALTAPYMHDGSLLTLMDVVLHYDRGGTPNPALSEKIFPLNLTEQERQDLVRFMQEALTGPVTEIEVPRLP